MKLKNKFILIFLLLLLLILGSGLGYIIYVDIINNQNLFFDITFYLLVAALIIILILIILNFPSKRNSNYIKKLENRVNLWNTISYKVKGAGETAFNKLPIGVMVLDNNYRIVWANNYCQEILNSSLREKSLKELHNGDLYEEFKKAEKNSDNKYTSEVSLYKQTFSLEILKEEHIIYLRNITEEKEINVLYNNRTLAFGYINIDNLEESIADLDVQSKSDCKAQILSTIISYAEKFNGYVQALSDSRYIFMSNKEYLDKMNEDKFSILDTIKTVLRTTKAFHITLSIGIGCSKTLNIVELTNLAQDMLELALNRGGDQAIVNIDGEIRSYGATTDPVRKESKVEIRFRYQELQDLILNSSKVFTTGHSYQDADAFASSLAMYNLALALGREAYIILDSTNLDKTVTRVYDDIKVQHRALFEHIITPDKAVELNDDKSLLLIVDCQAESQLFEKFRNKLSYFKTIGIIDHHRKNESGTIANPKFYYSEPAASSCVELIFTLLEFYPEELPFSSSEATWMLLGMVVDTNNFTYRTSSTTFEIAAILNRYQANLGVVKEYLKEDMATKVMRNKLVSKVEIYNDSVGIVAQEPNDDGNYEVVDSETISKVSDDVLTIKRIKLSITLGYVEIANKKRIKISARSLGDVNCQVIAEKLNGGGHLTAAAAVLDEKVSMEDAVLRVKSAINQVVTKMDKASVILLEDVKPYGKEGDIKELSSLEANEMISKNQAILATPDNLKIYEEEKKERQTIFNVSVKRLETAKANLEAKPIKLFIKTSEEGNLLERVSTKLLVDELSRIAGYPIDSRSITLDNPIEKLGSYDIEVKLGKNIIAFVNLQIIEK